MAHLNVDLIFKQNVTPERVYRLHLLHDLKDGLFRLAKKGANPDRCLMRLRQIEFEMQEAWGWEQDATKHTWKYLMPNTPLAIVSGTWAAEYLGHG